MLWQAGYGRSFVRSGIHFSEKIFARNRVLKKKPFAAAASETEESIKLNHRGIAYGNRVKDRFLSRKFSVEIRGTAW